MMELQLWTIEYYGSMSGFIAHLRLYLADLLDDPVHEALTPASSPLTPASNTSSPIEELPNTRNAIPPDSGSALFVPSSGTYNRLPDRSPGGCNNYHPSRGFEDDDCDIIPSVASNEDQGTGFEEISEAGGEVIVDAGGNNRITGNDEVMEDIANEVEDPKQLEDVHEDETMKDLGDDRCVQEGGSTDNPERPQAVNGVDGDKDADHSGADEPMGENIDASEDIEENDVGATGINGSNREDQEVSEGGAEDTRIDGYREDQEASEGGTEDSEIDGSIREDQEASEGGAEDSGIDGSIREDQEASEGGAKDSGIDGSIREDQEASEGGTEDSGIDGSIREDQEASEGGAEGSREVNGDENTGNAGDQDGIGRTRNKDEEVDKAQTKTRNRWLEAADRVIKEGLSITTRNSHIELLSVTYNHMAIRALLSLEVQGPDSCPLGPQTDSDPLRVAAKYLEYSTRLEERAKWYKQVGQFTQVVAVSWCEILRHSGCTNEEVDAMIQKSVGKNFTPRWLKDARRGVKFVHRLIRSLRDDGWGDTAFEIFFLCGHSLSGYSKLAETPEKSFEVLREKLNGKPPSEPDGWIPYSIPCIINAMTDRTLSLKSICAALGYDYNLSFEEVAGRIEKYCKERPAIDAARDNAPLLNNEGHAPRHVIEEAPSARVNSSGASFDDLPSSALNRDQVLTDFQQSDFSPFFDDQIPPSFNDDFRFSMVP